MKVYILFDKLNQPYVRGVYTSLKKAQKDMYELEQTTIHVNEIFGFKNESKRFKITQIDINRIYNIN